MSQIQKEEIKNSIKTSNNEKILKKIIKNDRRSKQYISRKAVDKNITSLPSKETYIRSGKRNFPTFKIISTNKLRMNKLNNKSFYKFNTLNRFSVSNLNKINNKLINNKLIELKNYGSSKDIYRTTAQDNHSLFISVPLETPHPSHKIKLETEKNNKLLKKTLNKGNEEVNSNKKQTTILYKRRNEKDNNNYSSIYSTLNNANKTTNSSTQTNNNRIMNYKINSITYKISTNKKSKIKPKNISEITNTYFKENQTFNNKGNRIIYIAPKKIESRFRTDDDYTFNPKIDLSVDNDNLLYQRLKRNETMVKKFRLSSIHNSSLGRNFFFNPLEKNLKNDISSFSKTINQSKEKNNINKKYNIRQSASNSGLSIVIEPKKNTLNGSTINYKDRRQSNVCKYIRYSIIL